MKKRSIVFLIVSGIIFAVGLIICLIGVGISASNGEQIYSAKIGDDRGYTYKFANGETDKIKISVTDANVNIYGTSSSSYIEVINFNENLTGYTANNSMITFRETGKIEDITGIWEGGISFKGLRYILKPVSSDKPKTVNIYISDDEHVKAFDIKLEHGTVQISSISTITDYHITVESGNINFSDISTGSGIDIKATGDISTDISFRHVDADMVTVNAKRAKFVGEEFTTSSCEMNITAGSSSFDFMPIGKLYTVEIATKGKLTVDGVSHLDKFVYPAEEDTDENDEENAPEPSVLKLSGDDLYVSITTPAGKEADKSTDTQTQ